MSDENEQDPGATLLPFEGNVRLIRRQWHEGQWYFSVVDVVALLTDSVDPGNYWAKVKRRVQDEGFAELVTKCHQLKMRSLDGKTYKTDATDVETMLRIIQSIPLPERSRSSNGSQRWGPSAWGRSPPVICWRV